MQDASKGGGEMPSTETVDVAAQAASSASTAVWYEHSPAIRAMLARVAGPDECEAAGHFNRLEAEFFQVEQEYRKALQKLDRTTAALWAAAGQPRVTPGTPTFPADFLTPPGVLPLYIVDVGAQVLTSSDHPYAPLTARGDCIIYGFEPLQEEAQKRADCEPGVMIFDTAIGTGAPGRLHVARFNPASSLLEPDLDFLRQFMALAEMCEPLEILPLETRRLDDIEQIAGCDYLKIDVQGGEGLVLAGAEKLIESTCVIHTEVEFAPLYRDQPLFADIDTHLRSRGFEFYDLLNLGYTQYAAGAAFTSKSRLLWADAVFVKNVDVLARDPKKLLKTAYIVHEVYGMLDFAKHLLRHYDALTGSLYADRYQEVVDA